MSAHGTGRFHRTPLSQALLMELVTTRGRRRGPPLERLAAHGTILHFIGRLGLVFWLTGPRVGTGQVDTQPPFLYELQKSF